MKKRADDIKKKSDHTNKGSKNEKVTDQDKSAAQEQENLGNEEVFRIPSMYWYLGLLATMLFSVYLRAVLPWKAVFTGNNTVMFSSESDAWYNMMLAKSTVLNLHRTFYDPLTNFPYGTPIHFGPFDSWGITILSYIVGLGRPALHTVDVVGAFWPVLMGTLLVLPAYFIGKELAGRGCGIITAILTVVLPGQLIARTTLGFTDHHASEILLSTMTMLFFLLALGTGSRLSLDSILKRDMKALKYPLLYTILAGISMGLYLDSWPLAVMFEGILLLALAVQSIVDHIRGRDTEYLGIIGGGALFIALLMILPFANSADGFNLNRYSLFQPTILLLGIIFALAVSTLSTLLNRAGLNRYYYPGSIVGAIILGFLVLKVAAPQFIGTFTSTLFTYLLPRVGGASTVAELSPLFANNGIDANFPGIIGQLSPFYFAVLGLVLLLYRYIKKEKPGDLLVAVWSLFILIITIDANRSAYYFAINVAILCAFLSIELVEMARLRKEMRLEHIVLSILLPSLLLLIVLSIFQTQNMLLLLLSTIILPIAVMLLVFDWMKRPLTRNLEISLILLISTMLFIFPSIPNSIAEAKYASGPTSDWYTSCVWLMNNTPNPGMDITLSTPGHQMVSSIPILTQHMV